MASAPTCCPPARPAAPRPRTPGGTEGLPVLCPPPARPGAAQVLHQTSTGGVGCEALLGPLLFPSLGVSVAFCMVSPQDPVHPLSTLCAVWP